MTAQDLFLQPLDKVVYIPNCAGDKVLINGSKKSQPTPAEKIYLYKVKYPKAPIQILFGSFLGEKDSLEDVCLTQHQILKVFGQNSFLFENESLAHLFLTKEEGKFIAIMLWAEKRSLCYYYERLQFFEVEEARIKKSVLYIPSLAIG